MIRAIMFALLIVLSIPAHCELFMDIGGISYHFGNRRSSEEPHAVTTYSDVGVEQTASDVRHGGSYNESNEGLGIRYEQPTSRLRQFAMAGYFHNSLDTTTWYVGGGVKWRSFGSDMYYLDLGVVTGLVTGYGNPIDIIMLPSMTSGIGRMSFTIMAAPQTHYSPTTLMLVSSFRIN